MSAPRVLVLDDRPPAPERDGASLRMLGLLAALRELGCEPAFGYIGEPRGWHASPPADPLLDGDTRIAAFLDGRPAIAAAILSRPAVGERWLEPVRRAAPGALLVYDTVDLHFLREFRGAKLAGDRVKLRRAVELRETEQRLARAADVTMAVSERERGELERLCPGARVCVVSNVHAARPLPVPFADRDGFLFVGGYGHAPNADAVEFLLGEVWPLVRERLPEARLTLAGPPAGDRAGQGVERPGHVPDLEPLLGRSLAMVAPLRYGAGVKGKVLLAMAHGLPVVGTPVALEGIGDGSEALVEGDPEGLAAAMVRLAADEPAWRGLRERALALVEREHSPEAARRALAEALAPVLEGSRV